MHSSDLNTRKASSWDHCRPSGVRYHIGLSSTALLLCRCSGIDDPLPRAPRVKGHVTSCKYQQWWPAGLAPNDTEGEQGKNTSAYPPTSNTPDSPSTAGAEEARHDRLLSSPPSLAWKGTPCLCLGTAKADALACPRPAGTREGEQKRPRGQTRLTTGRFCGSLTGRPTDRSSRPPKRGHNDFTFSRPFLPRA